MSTIIKRACRNGQSLLRVTSKSGLNQALSIQTRSLSHMTSIINRVSHANCHCQSCIANHSSIYSHRFNRNSVRYFSDQKQNAGADSNQPTNEAEEEVGEFELEEESNQEEMNELHSKVTQLSKDVDKWKDTAARFQADLFNSRSMSEKDIKNAKNFANKKFGKDMLGVADALHSAIDQFEKEISENKLDIDNNSHLKSLYNGVKLTHKTLMENFSRNGITLMDCKGEYFDPHKHEALAQIDSHEEEEGTILQVYSQGYLLHERVLRPAKVVVAKKPVEALGPDGDDNNDGDSDSQQKS